jgi:transcription elongation factor Elf1
MNIENLIEFEDYYPVEKCAKDMRRKFACPKCGHLEMNVKMIEYRPSWTMDEVVIECERCETRSTHTI